MAGGGGGPGELGLRRSVIAAVVLLGAYGKPRPTLIIQSDLFDEHPSVTVLPITSHWRDTPLFRLDLEPAPGNGLERLSQIMVDKVQTLSRDKMGQVIRHLDDHRMVEVNRALVMFLGLA